MVVKVIKNVPSALFSYNYKHAVTFKNTREVPREARAEGECFSWHFSSVLKSSRVLIIMTKQCTRNKFISFIKCPGDLSELSYLFARARACDVGSVYYNSTVHACDVGSVYYNSTVHAHDVKRVLFRRFNELDSTNQSASNSSTIL